MRAGAHPFPGHEPGGVDFAPGSGRTAPHCRRGRRRGSHDDAYSTARHLPWARRPGRRAGGTWRHRCGDYGAARRDHCAASRRGELSRVHLRPGGEPRGCGNGAAHRPSLAALRYPPRVSGDGSACRRAAVRRQEAVILTTQDLGKIADLTLEHYDRRAEDFWEGTRDHDVSQNIEALLRYIEGDPPFAILDFGCGPGRDLKAFAELGHIAVGLEGTARLAVMARAHSGGEGWQQDFLKPDL